MNGELRNHSGVRAFKACGFAGILLSSLWVALSAQDLATSTPQSPGVQKSGTTIRVNSNLVLIPVTVTDHSGKAVSGLGKDQFTLLEDNAQQEITHFAAEDAPASVGIIFDASDSMSPKLGKAREAVHALMSSINPNSEAFLVRFTTSAQLIVPMTNRLDDVSQAADTMRVGGTTALLDGVHMGMRQMTGARYSRKALVIISDGEDNASHWTVNELKAAVREQDILIYSIAISDAGEAYTSSLQLTGAALLREIANQSGGCMFSLNKIQQLPSITSKIGSWLRNQYVLGYVPNNGEMDGAYRKIQLKITRPKGFPRMQAVWRKGYYAPRE